MQSITQIAADLAAKKYSSEELTRDYLNRIATHNPTLNMFITIAEETALADARAADQFRATNPDRCTTLTGIPIAHKDNFCTQGHRTSCGSKMLDNFIAPYDATIVKNLKNHHTVMLGKTNMDEFAMGSSNENSYYGPVKNPWDLTRVPGGSSGGSAAAVAANLAVAATGSDTGGSIRQPAAFCGVTGIKPTYGLASRHGMVAFASSLDQAGPFAANAEDAATMLQAMLSADQANDSASIPAHIHTAPDYHATLNDPLDGLRIGVPKEFVNENLDPNIATIIMDAIKEYEKMGATIQEITLPNTHLAIPVYYIVAPVEAASNLLCYDGVRYGYRCKNPKDYADLCRRSRGEGFGSEVKRRIMVGTYCCSSADHHCDDYYEKAIRVRSLIRNDFIKAFETVDLIAGPTTPNIAFKLNEKIDDPVNMYLNDIYTVTTNLAGLPGLSLPAGFMDNLPIGLQLIGKHFSEARLLNAAHRFQQETDWHMRTPTSLED